MLANMCEEARNRYQIKSYKLCSNVKRQYLPIFKQNCQIIDFYQCYTKKGPIPQGLIKRSLDARFLRVMI
jgi:hypothetical protein